MQVDNSNSYHSQSIAALGVDKSALPNAHKERLNVEKNPQGFSKKSEQNQHQARLDIDDQVLAKVERNYQSKNFQQNVKNNHTNYDQPSKANQSAVSAYHSINNIAERDNIQHTFGVDLYA